MYVMEEFPGWGQVKEKLRMPSCVIGIETLLHMSQLKALKDRFADAASCEELSTMEQEFTDAYNRLMELSSMIPESITQVKRAVAAHKRKESKDERDKKKEAERASRRDPSGPASAGELAAAAAAAGRGGGGRGRGRGFGGGGKGGREAGRAPGGGGGGDSESIFSTAGTGYLAPATYPDLPAFKAAIEKLEVNFAKPYVIESVDGIEQFFKDDAKAKMALDILSEQFMHTKIGKLTGRATCPFTAPKPTLEALLQEASPPVGSLLNLADGSHEYVRAMKNVGLYGMVPSNVAPGRPYYGSEHLQCASLRFALPGAERRIFVMPWASLIECLGKTQIREVSNALKTLAARPELLDKLKAFTYEVCHRPGTVVYLPMAMFCADDVVCGPEDAKQNALGVRKSMLLKSNDPANYRDFEAMASMAKGENLEDGKTGLFMEVCLRSMEKNVASVACS